MWSRTSLEDPRNPPFAAGCSNSSENAVYRCLQAKDAIPMRIGIDTGGTFTDFVVAHDDGSIETFKIRSNPADPATVILQGLARAGATRRDEVVHGSTVATNALLERKGARVALVTTAGFEDV